MLCYKGGNCVSVSTRANVYTVISGLGIEAPAANPDLVNRLIVSTRSVLLPQGEAGEILYSCTDRQTDRQTEAEGLNTANVRVLSVC